MDPRCHCKFGDWWPNRTMGDVEVSESPYGSRYGVNMAGWVFGEHIGPVWLTGASVCEGLSY